MYCTYLTIYKGNKLPPFYIGYSTITKVENGYHGSVSSKKYKKIWYSELKNNADLFVTKIISIHENKEEAVEREEDLQRKMNVIHNPLYINRAIGKHYDNTGNHHSLETRILISIKAKGRTSPRKGIKCPGIGGRKKGSKPWNKGLKTGPLPEEQKIKQSISCRETVLEKGGIWNKGLKGIKGHTKGLYFYYDPITNKRKMFIEGEQPENWIKGMGINNKKGCWFYNPENMSETIFVEEINKPKGWLRGRGVTGKRTKGEKH